jgi:hypothetical protein
MRSLKQFSSFLIEPTLSTFRSFGVLVWEIMSYGEAPYQNLSLEVSHCFFLLFRNLWQSQFGGQPLFFRNLWQAQFGGQPFFLTF